MSTLGAVSPLWQARHVSRCGRLRSLEALLLLAELWQTVQVAPTFLRWSWCEKPGWASARQPNAKARAQTRPGAVPQVNKMILINFKIELSRILPVPMSRAVLGAAR